MIFRAHHIELLEPLIHLRMVLQTIEMQQRERERLLRLEREAREVRERIANQMREWRDAKTDLDNTDHFRSFVSQRVAGNRRRREADARRRSKQSARRRR